MKTCADAIFHAIDLIELAHGRDGDPEIEDTLKTLEAILNQRGMEANNVAPGEPLLTTVMDVAISG